MCWFFAKTAPRLSASLRGAAMWASGSLQPGPAAARMLLLVWVWGKRTGTSAVGGVLRVTRLLALKASLEVSAPPPHPPPPSESDAAIPPRRPAESQTRPPRVPSSDPCPAKCGSYKGHHNQARAKLRPGGPNAARKVILILNYIHQKQVIK